MKGKKKRNRMLRKEESKEEKEYVTSKRHHRKDIIKRKRSEDEYVTSSRHHRGDEQNQQTRHTEEEKLHTDAALSSDSSSSFAAQGTPHENLAAPASALRIDHLISHLELLPQQPGAAGHRGARLGNDVGEDNNSSEACSASGGEPSSRACRARDAKAFSEDRTAPSQSQADDEDISYAACDQLFNGLGVFDYALLSLASYFDPTDATLPLLLKEFFPPPVRFRLRDNLTTTWASDGMSKGMKGSSRLSWIEVEFSAGVGPHATAVKPMLVVAIRGTDPIRVSDYVEDIRMWTEPVAISILSTLFPTVRVWPYGTQIP